MTKTLATFLARLRRFRSSSDGSTAIEFALVFPIFLLLMMAIFQISMVFVASQNLENATAELGRYVRTGQTQESRILRAAFRQRICDRLMFFLDCDSGDFHIDVKVLPDFRSVPLDWPIDKEGKFTGTGSYQLGSGGEIVIVRTFYLLPVWLPMIGPTFANIGTNKRLIASASAFRNEPF